METGSPTWIVEGAVIEATGAATTVIVVERLTLNPAELVTVKV